MPKKSTINAVDKVKFEQKIDNWKDKYEQEKKSNLVKILFAILGVLVVCVATYFGVETSETDFKGFKFQANALHYIGFALISIPWLSQLFKKR